MKENSSTFVMKINYDKMLFFKQDFLHNNLKYFRDISNFLIDKRKHLRCVTPGEVPFFGPENVEFSC